MEQRIQGLIHSFTQTATIPKIVWTLWLQCWEQATKINEACLATWKRHNADWTIRALITSNLNNFLDDDIFSAIQGKHIEPEALSDAIRIYLLKRYGVYGLKATETPRIWRFHFKLTSTAVKTARSRMWPSSRTCS